MPINKSNKNKNSASFTNYFINFNIQANKTALCIYTVVHCLIIFVPNGKYITQNKE